MAITRAQIARELLRRGGPPGGGATSMGSGRDFSGGSKQDTGPKTSGSGKGRQDPMGGFSNVTAAQMRKTDPVQFGGGREDIFGGGRDSDGSGVTIKPPPPKPKETKFKKFKRTFNPFPVATSFLNRISNSKLARMNNALQRQNYIDSLDLTNPEEKEEYDRIMNQLGGLGMDIISGPEDLEDTSLKQPMSLGAPKTTFKTLDGVSTLGNPGVDDVLGQGYQDYLNRFETTDRDERPEEITDPCKGPNPPAYCFIGENVTEETDPTNIFAKAGITPRIAGSIFAADGGRIGAAEGGIMDLARQEMFLGGVADAIGKGLKKATRAVKKIAKSPIGKAAILGAGLGFAGVGPFKGLASTGFGQGLAGLRGTLFGQAGSRVGEAFVPYKEGLFTKLGLTKGGGSFMPTIKGGITLASILPLLVGKTEEEKKNILDEYYASQQLTPSQSVRGVGSEMDFYNYNIPLAEGGMPSKEPVAKETMPLLDMDGKEMDLRAEGGFVPIGRMEKADDVPARLSKNEFVFTADAVRNAGDGDVDKGAEVMYNMMKNLESGGDVSKESQGLEGAREMFQTSKRLEEVL